MCVLASVRVLQKVCRKDDYIGESETRPGELSEGRSTPFRADGRLLRSHTVNYSARYSAKMGLTRYIALTSTTISIITQKYGENDIGQTY
jgi:hypothetical protein